MAEQYTVKTNARRGVKLKWICIENLILFQAYSIKTEIMAQKYIFIARLEPATESETVSLLFKPHCGKHIYQPHSTHPFPRDKSTID